MDTQYYYDLFLEELGEWYDYKDVIKKVSEVCKKFDIDYDGFKSITEFAIDLIEDYKEDDNAAKKNSSWDDVIEKAKKLEDRIYERYVEDSEEEKIVICDVAGEHDIYSVFVTSNYHLYDGYNPEANWSNYRNDQDLVGGNSTSLCSCIWGWYKLQDGGDFKDGRYMGRLCSHGLSIWNKYGFPE